MTKYFNELYQQIVDGYILTPTEALELTQPQNIADLTQLADRLRELSHGNYFDTCSIMNARSGRCSEDCKWCAQSVHYKTNIDIYPLVDKNSAVQAARFNADNRIHRFSLVTSGKTVTSKEIEQICSTMRTIKLTIGIELCASMGLLSKTSMEALATSGVTRYHCNLETAPSYFNTLCTTHTTEDKIKTLKLAKTCGMTICSGGIIGMGETMAQRIELALVLRELNVDSIPINILTPIPGTPLENAKPLSKEETLASIAIIKAINPTAAVRLAGGQKLIKEYRKEAFKSGANAAILGQMLTTDGNEIKEDLKLLKSIGYTIFNEE